MRFYYFSATHWDREWYQPRQVYRKRLLTLTRRVLDLLEQQSEYRHFIFDGQTVVLDDVAEVHPEWRPRLAIAISGGRLKVGPWYVMPDEFLVSGEALIRNLQIGRAVAEEYGSAPWPVGYVCDIFGHMAQLPQLFAGFGLKGAVVWRGLASTEPPRFLWESPDGTRIRTIHLMPRNGYGQFTLDVRGGTDRSPEEKEFRERLRRCVEQDTAYWGKEAFLLSDGLDHSCPPEDPVSMLHWIAAEFPDAELVQTDYLDLFEREFGPEVSTVLRGELIHPADINGNWQISGTVSSRSDVKRANDLGSNRLELLVEPLLAERAAAGETGDLGLLHYLWKELVKNHAHDSICGCSIDSVHRRMLGRFGEVFDGARAIVDDQIQLDRERLTGVRLEKQSGDPADEVAPDGRYLLRLRNPLPFDVDRTAEYEICFPAAAPYAKRQAEPFGYEFVNSFQLRDEAGALVPYQIVSIRRNQMRQFQWNVFRRYDVYRVAFRTKLRAAGWTTLRLEPSPDFVRSYRTMRTSQRSATNGILRLDFHPEGTFDVTDLRSGRSFRNWNEFRFDREIGDGWNHVEPIGNAALLCSSESSLRVTLDGPEWTTFEITRRYRLPASLRYEGGLGENYVGIRESEEFAEVILRTTVTLDRDSHGNVKVSQIETEKFIVSCVQKELDALKAQGVYTGSFNAQCHFFGYEGRCGLPSCFDTNYCYALGYNAGVLIHEGLNGMMSTISNLDAPVEAWTAGGVPVTMMMNIERRNGKDEPVIKKALVELDGLPYQRFVEQAKKWRLGDCYSFPGPIQFTGPAANVINQTLAYEIEERRMRKH